VIDIIGSRPKRFELLTPRFVGWCSYGLKDLKKAGELETFAGGAANAEGTGRQAGRPAFFSNWEPNLGTLSPKNFT
jgi:hypothetical protein